ncbi:uncharacterized protein F4812DRAFT_422194 [Daldinia caldariorum]|uniref:uncharacterized protein n=1 Tax=Daldinia caldariorum TaxID=326644 RepID=UPI002007CCAD|nr:uncharacterized protein F4812DRAFT_422194 [Daldinia caldariorum]KAI1469160.1 hypothetical protein F4812DRAFT_422194 [Daldinia caldariorum]
MHPFSILTLAIFVAGYITARWDLVTRLYELAVFAWDKGVIVSKGFNCPVHLRSRGTGHLGERICERKNIYLIFDRFQSRPELLWDLLC